MRLSRSEGGRFRRILAGFGALLAWLCASAPEAGAQGPISGSAAARASDAFQDGVGECCVMLLYPIGARGVALSQSMAAVRAPEAVFHNPAGLAGLEQSVFAVHHVANAAQQIDAFSVIMQPFDLATFGLSYQLVDFGDEEATNSEGIPVGRITIRDHILIASFATDVFAGVSAGLNYKLYNARWSCAGTCGGIDVNAVTHGLDVGVQYRASWLPSLRLGAALLNAGFALQVVNRRQSDPMPTRLRLGAAYDLMHLFQARGPYALWMTVEAEDDDWRAPDSPSPSAGLELLVAELISLRAGYGAGEGVRSGPSVGIGLVYSNFHVDLAKRIGGADNLFGEDPFQISLAVHF